MAARSARPARSERGGRRWSAAAVTVALALTGTAFESAPAVGDELLTITQQIDQGIAAGETYITIEPGTYRQGSALNLGSVPNGTTIDATGVTLEMTTASPSVTAGTVHDLTLIGLSVTYDPLPYTQGRVVEVTSDGRMKVRIAAGYPMRYGDRTRTYDGDTDTTTYRGWTLDSHPTWFDEAEGIIISDSVGSPRNGDIVVYQWSDTQAPSISFDGTNVTLRDVTLYAAPGMGIMNSSGGGNALLDGVKIIPAPLPDGATDPPVQSTNWDATQFQAVIEGPRVIDSTITFPGDDITSIVGIGGMNITSVSGNTITVVTAGDRNRGPGSVHVGDRLAQWIDGPTAIVTAMSGTTTTRILTLDDVPDGWAVGTEITDLDRRGSGFEYSGNTFSGPGRVLIKTSDGVITGNDFRNSVKFAPETSARSQGYTGGNVVVSNNVFTEPASTDPEGYEQDQVGAVSIDGWNPFGVYSYPDMVIEGNVFDTVKGVNLMVKGGTDVTVSNNRFNQTFRTFGGNVGQQHGYPNSTPVFVTNSTDVHFEGNTIDVMGPRSTAPSVVWPDTARITGLPGGLEILDPFVEIDDQHGYTLENANSGLRMAPSGTAAGSGVQQQTASTALGQRWRVVPDGENVVRIQNVSTGLFVTASSGLHPVKQEPWATSASSAGGQQFTLIDVGGGQGQIQNVVSGWRLCIDGGAVTAGAPAAVYAATGSLNQVWTLTDAGAAEIAPLFTYPGAPSDAGMIGSPWSFDFTASGAPAPTYTLAAGSTLPQGLALDPGTGTISGSPTELGTFTYRVTAGNGVAPDATTSEYTLTVSPAPLKITSVAPADGGEAGGTRVTITGTGFTGVSDVMFGDAPATDRVVISDTELQVTTPAHAPGTVDVTVQTGTAELTSTGAFTYHPPPVVASLSPARGPASGGTPVTLTGTGFTAATGVTFDDVAGTGFSIVSDTEIEVTTPAHSPGMVAVTLESPYGVVPIDGGYTFDPAPTIGSVSPDHGAPAGGTVITITGTGFAPANTAAFAFDGTDARLSDRAALAVTAAAGEASATGVTFGGTPGTGFTVLGDTQIQVTAPAHAPGTVDVVVQSPNGDATLSGGYTYDAPPPPAGGGAGTTTGSRGGIAATGADPSLAGWTAAALIFAGLAILTSSLRRRRLHAKEAAARH